MEEGALTAHERKRALATLLDSPGWAILEQALKEQVHNRTQELILKPLKTLDESLAQEYTKGETAALQLVLIMPVTLYEAAAQDAAEQDIEKELADDDSSDVADATDYPDSEDWPG